MTKSKMAESLEAVAKAQAVQRQIGCCCIILHQGCVLMGYHKQRQGWEFPGGGVQPGESVLAAICREVREETGIRLPPQDLWQCCYDDKDPVWLNLGFVVSLVGREPPMVRVQPEGEHLDWQWFSLSHLPANMNHLARGVATTPTIELVKALGRRCRGGKLSADARARLSDRLLEREDEEDEEEEEGI